MKTTLPSRCYIHVTTTKGLFLLRVRTDEQEGFFVIVTKAKLYSVMMTKETFLSIPIRGDSIRTKYVPPCPIENCLNNIHLMFFYVSLVSSSGFSRPQSKEIISLVSTDC